MNYTRITCTFGEIVVNGGTFIFAVFYTTGAVKKL